MQDVSESDDGVDREDIPQKIKSGYFDMIIVDVRIFNEHVDLLQEAASPIAHSDLSLSSPGPGI